MLIASLMQVPAAASSTVLATASRGGTDDVGTAVTFVMVDGKASRAELGMELASFEPMDGGLCRISEPVVVGSVGRSAVLPAIGWTLDANCAVILTRLGSAQLELASMPRAEGTRSTETVLPYITYVPDAVSGSGASDGEPDQMSWTTPLRVARLILEALGIGPSAGCAEGRLVDLCLVGKKRLYTGWVKHTVQEQFGVMSTEIYGKVRYEQDLGSGEVDSGQYGGGYCHTSDFPGWSKKSCWRSDDAWINVDVTDKIQLEQGARWTNLFCVCDYTQWFRYFATKDLEDPYGYRCAITDGALPIFWQDVCQGGRF